MISSGIIIALILTGIAIIALPIIITLIFRCKTKYSLFPLLMGVFTFIIFVKVLEQIPHYFFIIQKNVISEAINNSTFLYVIYGISMAGIFEEIGRYIAFRFFLKNYKNPLTSISFGIGHGGIENIIVAGVGYFELATIGKMVNDGTIEQLYEMSKGNESTIAQIKGIVSTVENFELYFCFLGIMERIAATIAHIIFSVFVYKGVIENSKRYVAFAIILHSFFDIAPALYQKNAISLLAAEIAIFVITSILVYPSILIYSSIKIPDNSPENEIKNEDENLILLNQ